MPQTRAPAPARASRDGFEVLDDCHRRTLENLGKLDALVARLTEFGADAQARELAGEVFSFFSTVADQHHQDEERHVFPKLLASGDDKLVQAVLRLQQDHFWLAEDWLALAPQLDAVAAGQAWIELETLRETVEVFVALSHDHMELEELCVYPEARARLDLGDRREMGREMAARRRAHGRTAPPQS